MGYYDNLVTEFFLLLLLPFTFILLVDGVRLAARFITDGLPASSQDMWLVRLVQKIQLRHSHLARMLNVLGVEQKFYRRTVPVAVMRSQLDACAACTQKSACNKAINRQTASPDTIGFCPNKAWLGWAAAMPRD